VPLFITLNEPWCSAYLGYASGVHAPGRTDDAAALTAVHHLNLAHGLATAAVRRAAPTARVALTLNLAWVRPEKPDSALDTEAARRVDGLQNRVFLDPVLRGTYPADVQADTAAVTDWSFVRDGDLDVISGPIDVLGVNYYSPTVVRHWTRERPKENADGHGDGAASPWIACDDVEFPIQPGRKTDMGWSIDPRGLTELLVRVTREAAGLEIMVTENGAAFPDVVDGDGRIFDTDRIDYLRTHLAAVHAAIVEEFEVDAGEAARDLDRFVEQLDHVRDAFPRRLEADPERVERGLAQLVLTIIELLRQLMERQALARMEQGTLTDEQVDRLGETFMKLEERMQELKAEFGLEDSDLNLDLGPLGDLL
jgi:beta-glucosidase/6-phospho-beta-glucosidase/beta-galactosidase